MAYEYDIQRNLTYLGLGTLVAAPFTGGLSLLATTGIFIGKLGRYVRREFNQEFAEKYPLKKSPGKSSSKKIGNATRNFFRGFKEEHLNTNQRFKKEGKLENITTNVTIYDSSGRKIEEYNVRTPEEFIEQYLSKRNQSC